MSHPARRAPFCCVYSFCSCGVHGEGEATARRLPSLTRTATVGPRSCRGSGCALGIYRNLHDSPPFFFFWHVIAGSLESGCARVHLSTTSIPRRLARPTLQEMRGQCPAFAARPASQAHHNPSEPERRLPSPPLPFFHVACAYVIPSVAQETTVHRLPTRSLPPLNDSPGATTHRRNSLAAAHNRGSGSAPLGLPLTA